MASSNEITRQERTYEFILDQEDIVNMMNDSDVMLADGEVDVEQDFGVYLRKANGSEIRLKDMKPTDKLVFKFTSISISQNPQTFEEIDIE